MIFKTIKKEKGEDLQKKKEGHQNGKVGSSFENPLLVAARRQKAASIKMSHLKISAGIRDAGEGQCKC